MQPDVIVYFDYLCPYAWRGAELVEMVSEETGLKFEWRQFSLMQNNSKEPDFQIWNDRLDASDPSGTGGLLPFLAGLAARRQGCAAGDSFRLGLQRARHMDHRSFSHETILKVAAECGLDVERFSSDLNDPELRTELAQEHYQAEQLNIFGTPTFRFCETGDTAYLRIKELPRDRSEAVELFMKYRSLLTDYPYVETVKRPRNGGN